MTNTLYQDGFPIASSRTIAFLPRNPLRRILWRVQLFMRRKVEGNTYSRIIANPSADILVAVRIWKRVIRQPESVLIYNPKTDECFAEWIDPACPVYLFLENSRIRIVNTVVGYDVVLDPMTADWCFRFFTREINRRRTDFKRDALSKVAHSLDGLEVRLVDSENQVSNW